MPKLRLFSTNLFLSLRGIKKLGSNNHVSTAVWRIDEDVLEQVTSCFKDEIRQLISEGNGYFDAVIWASSYQGADHDLGRLDSDELVSMLPVDKVVQGDLPFEIHNQKGILRWISHFTPEGYFSINADALNPPLNSNL